VGAGVSGSAGGKRGNIINGGSFSLAENKADLGSVEGKMKRRSIQKNNAPSTLRERGGKGRTKSSKKEKLIIR